MPRKTITITDVTAMRNRRICIAGYDREQNCMRPVLPAPGVSIDHFIIDDELIIFPTAKVQFDFTIHSDSPPHVEDYYIDRESISFKSIIEEVKWIRLLSQTDDNSFSNLFPSMTDRYVLPGSDGPSLGTIKANSFLFYVSDLQPLKLKAMVQDQDDETISNIPIKDIVFTQYFLQKMRRHGNNYSIAKRKILELMRDREIYIRFSLVRPWRPEHLMQRVCYLQVSGVYTVPDLYNGNYKRWIMKWSNSLE